MNEFSIVCRVLGTLFYRRPEDPIVGPLMGLINSGQLKQHWPLEQDELLVSLQTTPVEQKVLINDYQSLFGLNGCASPYRSNYAAGEESACQAFLQQVGMKASDGPADHFGLLLLTASWIEDNAQEDEIQAQITLFDKLLLPWCGNFLAKVEAHATTAFYRTLAIITRQALQAMRDELNEVENQLTGNQI